MPPGRPQIVIDRDLLRSGQTASAIAKLAGCSWRTVLRRQHEQGVPGRRQGQRDWPQPMPMLILENVPAWMNDDPIVPTRRTWA